MPKRGRGRPGGGKKVRGGRPPRPTTRKPVPPSEAPPTEGLLGSAAPPVEQQTVIPLAPPPQQTEGLLSPAESAEPVWNPEDTLTPEVWRAVGFSPPTGIAVPMLRQGAPGEAPGRTGCAPCCARRWPSGPRTSGPSGSRSPSPR
ncbi:hypothetical protein ACFQ0T_22730 [Kitasatospora gansuensis]